MKMIKKLRAKIFSVFGQNVGSAIVTTGTGLTLFISSIGKKSSESKLALIIFSLLFLVLGIILFIILYKDTKKEKSN